MCIVLALGFDDDTVVSVLELLLKKRRDGLNTEPYFQTNFALNDNEVRSRTRVEGEDREAGNEISCSVPPRIP